MRKLGKFIIWAAAAAAAIAAVLAVLYKLKQMSDQKKEEEDDYLMNDDSSAPADDAGKIDSHLHHDLQSFGELKDGETLQISFHVPADLAKAFQEKLAGMGISSSLDSANNIADATVKGPMGKAQLAELSQALDAAAKDSNAEYDGFSFE